MKNIIKTAMTFFQEQLKQATSSRDYLKDRGFKEDEMAIIGESIAKVLRCINDPSAIEEVRQEILSLCKDFPLYPDMEY